MPACPKYQMMMEGNRAPTSVVSPMPATSMASPQMSMPAGMMSGPPRSMSMPMPMQPGNVKCSGELMCLIYI